MMKNAVLISMTMAALMLALPACSNNSSNPYGSSGNTGTGGGPPPNTIFMQNLAFSPASITITKGTTLTWQNKDGFTHTSTSDSAGVWDTGDVGSGGSKSVTFSTAGVFHYHCKYHGGMGMVGTITVH